MALSHRVLSLAALTCTALTSLTASTTFAQDTDYTLSSVRPMQIIRTGALIGERPVTVRALIAVSGPNTPNVSMDGLMRVYVDGIEAMDSPVFSLNGPLLVEGDSDPTLSKSMLNFAYIPPVSDDVVFEVQLNPPGPNHVLETDLSNNTTSTASLSFGEQELLTLMYSPIDYRPSGGAVPNLPDDDLIKPGVGDAFVQGIYPGGEFEYRRTDAPSKLWTSSLSGSGSALNSSLKTDLLLTNPRPDFIYGWVPGGLPYNGQAFINDVASMGNTQTSRHQRTYAHELGHNFGQFHNSLTTNVLGEDVERHLAIPLSLGKIKIKTLLDIMVPGQLTPTAWIHQSTFESFYNHPDLSLPATDQDAGDDAAGSGQPTPHLLVSGRWDRQTGDLSLQPVLEIMATEASRPALPGQEDLLIRGLLNGAPVGGFALSARSSADEGSCAEVPAESDQDSDMPSDPVTHFTALIPAQTLDGQRLEGLSITAAGTHPAVPTTIRASAHAPEITVLSPTAQTLTGQQLTLRWDTHDADGDALHTTVRYVPDGQHKTLPLITHSTANVATIDLAGLPHFVPGQGYIELLVSDGFHTTRATTAPLNGPGAYASAGGQPPFVEIYHPDDQKNFKKSSSVILHSSGWDLEDNALTGASIQWTSDLDGNLGSGRRFIVSTLSLGTHQITVTATDSAGQQTSRTHTLTINDRDLPDVTGEFCALDLGLAGPGNAAVSLCGDDLTMAGGSADLELAGAPSNTTAYLALGLANGSVPLKGGTLVPFPWASLTALQTDGMGALSIPNVTGTGTPLTVFLQFILVDPVQTQGFGFSNALQVEF